MSTTVVTGANGHIGMALITRLLELGRAVRAVDKEVGPWLRELDVDVRLGDIRDEAFMRSCLAKDDVLYHLASVISVSGDRKGLLRSINVEGARGVARAALEQGVRRMIHFSSVYVFDLVTRGQPVTESTRLVTETGSTAAYNCTKALGQIAVLELVPRGLDVVVVNPCGIIGPYDFKVSLQGATIRGLMKGRRWHPPGGFNWVDVRDVVEGALQAEAKGRRGECYILGHPDHTTHLDLARMVREITGVAYEDKVIPMPVLRGLATVLGLVERVTGAEQLLTHEALDSLMSNPEISSDKAIRELGYQVRPIADSVRDIHAWYLKTGQIDPVRS